MLLVAVAGCGSSGDTSHDPALSFSALRKAPPRRCPLPLDPALAEADHKGDGTVTGHVETAPPARQTSPVAAQRAGASALSAWDAVDVACAKGDVKVEMLALGRGPDGDSRTAVGLLIPTLSRAGIDVNQLREITLGDKAGPGELLEVPGDAPLAVAVAGVDGARSAAMVVSGPDRGAAESIAAALVARI